MRQTIDKLATLLLRLLLPITALCLPLFFLPLTTDFFLTNKNLFILIIGSLALIAWLVRNITRRRIHISLTPTTLPLLLLALTYIISAIFQSSNPYLALMGRTAIIIALTSLYLGVTSSQKNRQVIHLTYGALIISAIVASLVSFYSFIGLNSALSAPSWLTAKTFNPLGGPVPLLTYILPLLPVTLFLGLKATRWQLRTGLLFVTGLLSAAALSQISLLLPKSGNQIFLLPIPAGWSIAVDIFKNWRTALIGIGPENFLSAFTRLKPAFLNQTNLWDIRFNSSSNELFTILTTTGLLGVIFWLTALIRPILLGLKQKATPDLTAGIILIITTSLANLIVPANPVLLGLTFISLALLNLSLKIDTHAIKDISLNLSATETGHSPYSELPDVKTASFQLLPWLFALVLIPALTYFWYLQVRSYGANIATYKALQTINTNATESYNQQIRAYSLEEKNPYYRLNFSQTSLSLANAIASQKDLSDQDKSNITQLAQQAIREAKNATQLDPGNVLVWENLAQVYRQLINFAQGASDWTIASYRQTISLDPNNPRLHLELGGVYFALKDYDSAQREYETAISTKPDFANAHYNLAVIHQAKKDYAKALSEMRIVVQLVDPNSADYQQAQNELKELEKLAPTQSKSEPGQELITPTPIPSGQPKVNLDDSSAPDLP